MADWAATSPASRYTPYRIRKSLGLSHNQSTSSIIGNVTAKRHAFVCSSIIVATSNVVRLTEHSFYIDYTKATSYWPIGAPRRPITPPRFSPRSSVIVPDHRSNGYLGISSIACRPVEAGRGGGIGKFPAFLSRNNRSNPRSLESLNGCLLLFRSLWLRYGMAYRNVPAYWRRKSQGQPWLFLRYDQRV